MQQVEKNKFTRSHELKKSKKFGTIHCLHCKDHRHDDHISVQSPPIMQKLALSTSNKACP